MRKNLSKKRLEKGLSLFEIFILTISIFTFAYFLGNEFQIVEAHAVVETGYIAPHGGVPTEFNLAGPSATAAPAPAQAIPAATTPSVPPGAPPLGTTGQSPLSQTVASASAPPATPGYNIWNVIAENWVSMTVNLAIAVVIWAGVYYGIGALCPSCSKDMLMNLGLYLGIGYGATSLLAVLIFGNGPGALGILGIAGAGWGLIGMAAGFILFLLIYRQTRIDAVIFNCFPWQPKTGGADCAKCDNGPFSCTQYKCDTLGQKCKFLNADTNFGVCAYVGKNDITSPKISSWDGPLDKTNYEYIPDTARMPPDRGVIIQYKNSADGCAPPFSRIDYGITLDEPGSCKEDVIRTDNMSSMRITIDKGYYLYNHSLFSINAGANESAAEGIAYSSGGQYEVFVRCQDGNEPPNVNTGTFVFKYCVQNTPDTTAPEIKITSPINGMPVAVGTTSQKVDVYTNKPADCKWSQTDQDYNTMAGTMSCDQRISDINANMLYKCTGTLTGLKDNSENKFYFRCKSYPNAAKDSDRVKNTESYVYKLIGTRALVISSLTPASGTTIKDSTPSVKVTITAQTSAGYNNGQAKCSLKPSSASDKNYVLFLDTNSYQSTQALSLTSNTYSYTVKCCDLGNNCDTKSTSFTVATDFQPPVVVRTYNEGGKLDIVTDESSQCVYSTDDSIKCSYNFDDGIKMTTSNNIEHFTDWNTNNNFYVKCKDAFGNQPATDGCSIIVRPFSSY